MSASFPAELFYSPEHEWLLKKSETVVRIGITDYAQEQLGDVVFVQLPDDGSEITSGDSFAEVESTKSVSDIYAPLTGRVVAINGDLDTSPDLVNTDSYGEGWIVEIEVDSPEDLESALEQVLAALTGRLLSTLDGAFMVINDEFRTDTPAPTSPHLSAGPASEVSWEDLGRQGRLFISGAPTATQVSEFTGTDAVEPVRAYVGVGGNRLVELRGQADRAVAELERLGGFDRAVLNVATGTGRGWVNENQVRALEYMWGGDVATVSLQYSYLPSWLSFLVDTQRAQDAGRLLFEGVYAHWLELPEDRRPLLVVSGESLGSFGGEAAFGGAQDLVARTSGALFVGPTGNNRLWSRFTEERDPGTPAVLPTYQQGRSVRFADTVDDWDRPGGDWPQPRVGYLQHANDPITWWDWSLAVEKPDWLREPRGRDVLPEVRWIPVVTWLQLAADQFVASAVPDGQGHEFGQTPVLAWARILPSPGWTDADAARLADLIGTQIER